MNKRLRQFVNIMANWSIIIIIVVMIIISEYNKKQSEYQEDKSEYDKYYERYVSLDNEINLKKVEILGLMDDEVYYEDYLYQSMISYYNASEDEVFQRVFQERFPLPNEYENDRKSAFVIIYALLEMYPELRDNSVISESLIGIDNTTTRLNESIIIYDDLCDTMLEFISIINNCDYIINWDNDDYIVSIPIYTEFVTE